MSEWPESARIVVDLLQRDNARLADALERVLRGRDDPKVILETATLALGPNRSTSILGDELVDRTQPPEKSAGSSRKQRPVVDSQEPDNAA